MTAKKGFIYALIALLTQRGRLMAAYYFYRLWRLGKLLLIFILSKKED